MHLRTTFLSILAIAMGSAAMTACGGDDAPATTGGGTSGDGNVVSVTTDSATNVKEGGATLFGTVTGLVSGQTCTHGFAYSESPTDLQNATKEISSDTGNGRFAAQVSSLKSSTTYYYCAFVQVNNTYKYGETKSFLTKSGTSGSTIGSPVDLGLSVKWADHNVGASSPETFGGYYAWGETETKTVYNDSTYATTRELLKNITNICGTKYDVAHVKWGGNWRLPTYDEIMELVNNCTREMWQIGTVFGIRFKSKINGNSIFIPYAQAWDGAKKPSGEQVLIAYWWGGNYYNGSPSFISGYNYGGLTYGGENPSRGFSVRPVEP